MKGQTIPYSADAEKAILGIMLTYPDRVVRVAEALMTDDFFVPAHRVVFSTICRLQAKGRVPDILTTHQSLVDDGEAQQCGSPGLLVECGNAFASELNLESYLQTVRSRARARAKIKEAETLIAEARANPDQFSEISVDTLLDTNRFDLSAPPPPPRPIYAIGKAVICTPANLTVIAAQAKAGKSALVGAFIAAATGGHGDKLGINSSNTDERALIHVDSEQSRADHHAIVATALRRVGFTTQPAWLRSYRLAVVSTRERFELLEWELKRAQKAHGGIHSVILDGCADFIADPNDSGEAFAAVDRLHRLAVTFDTSIICVLHFNPGSEFNKTRGHLGSQLERKAETNLALEKTDGVTVVYTKLARHAHIEKDAGPRFQWDSETSMHVSCGTARDEKAEADSFHLQAIADEIFSEKSMLRYSELLREVMRVNNVKETAAENTIKKMVPRFIKRGLGKMYEKAS